MKKTIMLIILIVTTLPCFVFAASDNFYEGEYLPDAYIKKFKGGNNTGKYEHMRIFRRTSDNVPAYCIEIWENLSSTELMNSVNIDSYNLLPNEVLNRIELYAYYGYGYQDHTDLNWYTATQFLIWKEISPDSVIYFTDNLNGNRVEKFTSEMNEIISLVNNHYILPSFHGNLYELGLNEELIIEDNNNVLNNYEVVVNYLNPAYKYSDNAIKVKTNHSGTTNIALEKGSYTNRTQIYTSNNSQDLLVRGNYKPVKSYLTLKVIAGKIYLSKVDDDTKTFIPQGEASLEGTTYNLYNSNNKQIRTVKIDSSGKAIFNDLPFDTYYIKENSTGIGYQLDHNIYKVTVTKDSPNKYLTLSNKVIKNIIQINKFYQELNQEELLYEANALFSFYDRNNIKVGEILTDKNGTGEITLPYGTYLIKQEIGKENYELVEDFYIEVRENKLTPIQINLTNKEIGYYLSVIKIDSDSKLPIRFSKTKFKIKYLENNTYLKYNDKEVFETNDNGIVELPFKLRKGKYQLEEIKAPIGYLKQKEPYQFEIIDSDITLKIENTKELGKLEIIKYGEKVTVENNRLEYSKELLSNVEYSLYASEDIISNDGKIHYKKDQLITKNKTDEKGKLIFDKLVYGKYYVVETKQLAPYNADFNKYYVEINKDNLNQVLEKINNLKKGNIIINKVDSLTLLPIYNVEFELYNENNIKIDTLKTNNSGEIYIADLPLGIYYIKESKTPFPYLLDKNIIKVELTENNELIEVDLKNQKQYLEEVVPNTRVEEKKINIIPYVSLLGNLICLAHYFRKI